MVSLEGFLNVFWWDAPPISRIPNVDPEFPGANLPFKKLREIQAYIPSKAPETTFTSVSGLNVNGHLALSLNNILTLFIMASDWRFLISRIPAVANRKIGVEACFATGSERGGSGEGWKFRWRYFLNWAGKFGKYFPLGAWLDSSRDFWVLVSQVLLEWLPDVEK